MNKSNRKTANLTDMRFTYWLLMFLTLGVCYGCTNKQTVCYALPQEDSVFVYDFYKSMNGISIEDVEDFITKDSNN